MLSQRHQISTGCALISGASLDCAPAIGSVSRQDRGRSATLPPAGSIECCRPCPHAAASADPGVSGGCDLRRNLRAAERATGERERLNLLAEHVLDVWLWTLAQVFTLEPSYCRYSAPATKVSTADVLKAVVPTCMCASMTPPAMLQRRVGTCNRLDHPDVFAVTRLLL